MAATDLNTVRSTIEARLATELASSPAIPVVFNNMAFDSTTEDTFVQCITSFGAGEYLTMGGTSDSDNNVVGLVLLNVFTEEGLGAGSNFTICKRAPRTVTQKKKTIEKHSKNLWHAGVSQIHLPQKCCKTHEIRTAMCTRLRAHV